MWLIDMWLSRMGMASRWPCHRGHGGRRPMASGVASRIGREGREAVRGKALGQVVEGSGPGVGEDAVEVAAKGAVGPALAVDGQDAMAVDADVEEVGAGCGQSVGCRDAGAGADGGTGGEGPAVLVGVEGDLHKDGKGIAVAAGVEMVDLVAEGDGDLGVDDVLGAVEGELASMKDGDHSLPPGGVWIKYSMDVRVYLRGLEIRDWRLGDWIFGIGDLVPMGWFA